MDRFVVEIKLVGVTFVPTYWEVNPESGEDVTAKRTIIGQLVYGCEFLPEEVQRRLASIIQEAYINRLENSMEVNDADS